MNKLHCIYQRKRLYRLAQATPIRVSGQLPPRQYYPPDNYPRTITPGQIPPGQIPPRQLPP